MKTHDQWKKAIINLECFSSSVSREQSMLESRILYERFHDGEIDTDKYSELRLQLAKQDINKKYTGTAIFIMHASKYFLLTARHVVYDIDSAQHITEEEKKYTDIDNKIFNKIVFVPRLDQFQSGLKFYHVLMNLNAGSKQYQKFTFSEPEIDLAIISLSQRYDSSIDELLKFGYEPILFEDIEDEPSNECVDIMTIGFLGATSKLGEALLHSSEIFWTSSQFSLPTTSFGKVSMLHKDLYYYWADFSIYQGNSGGPVIENGKLVGIVSSNALIKIENSNNKTRIPFGRIIKSKYIWQLFKEQAIKDGMLENLEKP